MEYFFAILQLVAEPVFYILGSVAFVCYILEKRKR